MPVAAPSYGLPPTSMSHKNPETFEGLLKDLALGQIYLQEDLAFFFA